MSSQTLVRDFHHGRVHLVLDLFEQERLALVDDLVDVRGQVAGVRVDHLKLFLDAEGEFVGRAGGGRRSGRGGRGRSNNHIEEKGKAKTGDGTMVAH